MTILSVSNLSVSYGQITAVRDVTFSINAGEVVVLLGPNGAGKTSAVEAIAGLIPKSGGKVKFLGDDLTKLDAATIAKKGLALVPQWRELFTNFSVEETLLAGMTAAASRGHHSLDHVYGLFPRLRERCHQLAGSLSGGEQQMLAVARALIAKPKLILLDEPSAGLAVGIVKNLIEIVRQISQSGVPMLLVEQNVELARAIGTRCCILRAGQLTWSGSVVDALNSDAASHAYFGH